MKKQILKFGILVFIAISLTACCCPTDPTPNGIISEAEATAMSDLYIANQYKFINENISGLDNLSVNFSLEDLEDYICLVKKEAGNDYGNLGLRVYFGAKEVEEVGVSRSNRSSGTIVPRTTVFFVPTSTNSTTTLDIPNGSILNMGDSGNNGFKGTSP